MSENSGRVDENGSLKKVSAKGLKEYLNYTIDAEVQKPTAEINSDLIEECVDWSLEMEGRQIKIPEDKIKAVTQSIVTSHYKPTRKLLNIFTIVAACVLIVLSIQFVSMTAFHENLTKDLYEEVQHLFHHYFMHDDNSHVTFVDEKVFDEFT